MGSINMTLKRNTYRVMNIAAVFKPLYSKENTSNYDLINPREEITTYKEHN